MAEEKDRYIYEYLYNSVLRMGLTFREYESAYKDFVYAHETVYDFSEYRFIELEIDAISKFLEYIIYFEYPNEVEISEKIKSFKGAYSSFIDKVDELIRQKSITIGNSNRRKLEFLTRRRSEIENEGFVLKAKGLEEENAKLGFEPILLTEAINVNEFVAIFFDLLEEHKIKTTKENIKKMLSSVFKDKNGNPLKSTTLETYLNKSKPLSRPKKG